jgi:SAM-dependent methyltransferase
MSADVAQRTIAAWFDATYTRKGMRYLRPLRAYWIFPELLGVTQQDTLLDIACGPGVLLRAASEYTQRLYGCDISAVAVQKARTRISAARVLVANAESLPYRTGAFDVVTCLGSLERMLDRRRVLREMLRIGSTRARYCFLVRNSNTRSWRCAAQNNARQPSLGHLDADTLENWTSLFESTGFSVRRVLPDQYPLLRRRLWRGLCLRRVDFRKPIVPDEPLERSNEFVFILEKQP